MKKTGFAVIVCTACAMGLWGCRKKADDGAETPPPVSVGPVESSETVETGDKADLRTQAKPPESPAGRIALKVFYAGMPDTERAKDFTGFLTSHFVEVGQGDYAGFRPEQAAGYNVVILDYDGVGLSSPMPELPRDYARATVTVGAPGADMGGRLGLKTGYL